MSTAALVDMSILATDTTFGNRVFASLCLYCSSTIPSELITSATVNLHIARKALAAQILGNQSSINPWKLLFVSVASINQTVANDAVNSATGQANGGTLVGLPATGASSVATAAASCTDTDINNAVAAAFNSFVGSFG